MKTKIPRHWAVVHTATQSVAYGETTKVKAGKLSGEGFEVVRVDKPIPENAAQLWKAKTPIHLITLCDNPFTVTNGFN